jgi:hypothetical protein
LLNNFGFRKKQEHQRFLGAADTDWLVGLIEDENFCVERRAGRGLLRTLLNGGSLMMSLTEGNSPVVKIVHIKYFRTHFSH